VGQASFGDGGFVPQLAGSALSADQRAIVVFDDQQETLILQTAYEGDRSDFAWVIPVPKLLGAGNVSTVSADIFDELYWLTEPAAYGYRASHASCLMGCSSGSGPEQFRSVRVWDTFQVDDYELTILSAAESSDLASWLDANAFAFPPDHQDELDYYVNSSWFFVAAKINPATREDNAALPPGAGGGYGEGTEEMRPLCLSFTTDEPVYPLRISTVSTQSEVEVLLYVIAPHRMTAGNYNTADVRLSGDFPGGDFSAYYEKEFRDNLSRAGVGSLLVEYTGPFPGYLANAYSADLGLGAGEFYVTRLRSYLTPEEMQQDVNLVQAGTDDSFAIRVTIAQANIGKLQLAGTVLFLGMVAVLGLSRTNRHPLLQAVLVVLAVGLLLI